MRSVSMAHWVKKQPLTAYFCLAFLITWIAIAPLVLSAQQLWAVPVSPLWHALGALGPISAAFLVTALAEGKPGMNDLWRRLGRWRVGGGWLLVAIGSPLLLFLLAALLLRITSGAWPDLSKITTGENATWLWIGSSLLFAGAYGFGEEVGWRGFALPRLQQGRSPLAATTILTLFWALWHLPMFFYRFEFGLGQLLGFFIALFAGAIWLTWLYNRTGGSILMVALWHAIWNIVNIFGLPISDDLVAIMSAFVMITAVVLVSLGRGTLLAPAGKAHALLMAERDGRRKPT